MPRPRRAAQPVPRRGWVLGLGIVVVLAVAALVLGPALRDKVGGAPSDSAAGSSSPVGEPSPATSSSPVTSATPPTDQDGAQVLDACRARVAAGDKVLTVAKKGMRHWSEHIQAQTDADAGRITVDEMNAMFRQTRLSGPDDARQYDQAVRELRQSKGSCGKADHASGTVARQLKACAERRRAQEPVLAAADDGMTDWKRHLNDMRRSDRGVVADPAQEWVRTWRAAPPHINAYRRAVVAFDPPSC